MGFLPFLKFLAWPVLALGYPLWASIRAIETGSKNHMRKLVIYWTLFSFLSLCEIAFVRIIEWIPNWSYIKLIVICGLVLPRFNGARYVYESLVQPCLSFNYLHLLEVMRRLYRAKEDKPVNTEGFLDFAEKYIKENGPEALEKLIASKTQLECMKPDSSPTDKQVKKPEEQKVAATLTQLEKEQDTTLEDKVMLQRTEQSATKPNATYKLANHTQPNCGTLVEKKSDVTDAAKEMAPPNTEAAESSCPETPPVMQVQREWTCALCLFTTKSEKTLQDHFQGMEHESKCEQQKISKNAQKGKGPSSPLTEDKAVKAKAEAVNKPAGDGLLPKTSKKARKRGKAQLATSDQRTPAYQYDGAWKDI